MSEKDQTDKELIIVVIEHVLSRMGNGEFDQVVGKLLEKYGCNMTDCDEHPEYLKAALGEIFPNDANFILKSITKELAKASKSERISRFLDGISQ